jgi:hypothetical protein
MRTLRELDVPGDTSMQSFGLYDLTEIILCGGYFVWVNEAEQRLADESVALVIEVVRKDGVKIYEIEVGREKSPIYYSKCINRLIPHAKHTTQ